MSADRSCRGTLEWARTIWSGGTFPSILLPASVVLIAIACDDVDDATEPKEMAVPLAPVASSEAPLSRNRHIALATEMAACVIDDYESRVHCIHRDDGHPAVFGWRGEGPGELPDASGRIVRGPDATVGVVTAGRMSIFEASGTLIPDISLPERLIPSAPFDSILSGVAEYPTHEDVERYLERCRSPASRFLGLPCEPERFRITPKNYSVHYWIDDQDCLWVLTNRDREAFSYLDIFIGPEFVGSVRVRHRAVGFDVVGSTLAMLVDRPVGPDDPDGFPDRGIDWYDIGGLEFGSQAF